VNCSLHQALQSSGLFYVSLHWLVVGWYCCDRKSRAHAMCAKLRTVAASNNRDHPTRSLSSSPLASTINCSLGSQALLQVTHQDHSVGITLLLLVRATYIYFCSSRTSCSWWIIQSTQHHRRGCNNTWPDSFFLSQTWYAKCRWYQSAKPKHL